MLLNAGYGAVLTPENLSGADMTVAAFSAVDGSTEPRDVFTGDVVVGVTSISGGAARASLWIVREGVDWLLAGTQPVAGDMIVSIVSAADLPYQAGSVVVVAEDGSFVPANFGLLLALTGNL